eukprot:NODE_251_length_11743_cov_0.676788.p2 type:complete len:186 gc:universal NODE_251_length_11743_cov_0.676788:1079-522(-)
MEVIIKLMKNQPIICPCVRGYKSSQSTSNIVIITLQRNESNTNTFQSRLQYLVVQLTQICMLKKLSHLEADELFDTQSIHLFKCRVDRSTLANISVNDKQALQKIYLLREMQFLILATRRFYLVQYNRKLKKHQNQIQLQMVKLTNIGLSLDQNSTLTKHPGPKSVKLHSFITTMVACRLNRFKS